MIYPHHISVVAGFVAAAVVNIAAATVSLADHLDLWAPAANTFMLILLAYMSRKNKKEISDKVDTVHESVAHGATAAANAAAAAADSARIVREIGGAMRSVDTTPLENK